MSTHEKNGSLQAMSEYLSVFKSQQQKLLVITVAGIGVLTFASLYLYYRKRKQKSRFFVLSLFDEADNGVKARSEQKVKFLLDGKSTTAGNRIYYSQQRNYSRNTRSLLRSRQGKRQFMEDELISNSETSSTEMDSWIERDVKNMSSDASSWSNFAPSSSDTSSVSLAPPTPAPPLRRPPTQGQKAEINGVT